MPPPPPAEPLRVSAAAARRIAEILAGETPGAMLRVAVEGGGCSGFQYRFAIAETAAADDIRIPAGAAIVLVDPVSAPFLAGSELDFVTELIGQSFQIRNPNATSSCGCGTSFTL
ncbi:MAG: iron-sulfur cluster assembly accessory protein [Hyphomicrobiales bacterium]|nr:iron-sulfur cluster assembly accessory protein [Hyphomicrobiales bacterium]MCA1998523.1 iron-sulfur cluster assembly accessory protein [Hyphomicrobiales bacterium]